jgi:hypothetical protein
VGVDVLYRRAIRTSDIYLYNFFSATCTLDEPDNNFSRKLLLYFAFFVKWVKIGEARYDIVYMDETWANQNHCTDYMWLPNDGSDAPKITSGKGNI